MADTTESIPEAGPPSRDEASSWVGWDLDEVGGAPVGRVHAVYVDSDGGAPAWLIAALGQGGLLGRRRATLVAVPVRDCAGAGGRVWTAHERNSLRDAPVIDPTRPLLREHELAICGHYGIG
ncbi:MAG TPA: hypothetical protein VGF09_05810, partial [Solirubrobacterales bacterium]